MLFSVSVTAARQYYDSGIFLLLICWRPRCSRRCLLGVLLPVRLVHRLAYGLAHWLVPCFVFRPCRPRVPTR